MEQDFSVNLQGKVAIVTGASQGLGADIALALCGAGAWVLMVGLGQEQGQATLARLNAVGRAHFLHADIRDDAQLDACVQLALEQTGRIDILVNNACSYGDQGLASSRALWHETLDVNLVSSAILAQKASAYMGQGGVIINMGSTGGKFGVAGRALYPASKAAILQLTKSLAVELAPAGIRVLTVSPAWTWSPATQSMAAGSRERADQVGAQVHPLGRVGSGQEVAQAVLFAVSGAASWMTGVDLPVDGGFSVLGPDQGRSPRHWFEAWAQRHAG
ncbi:SDR family oxidoreductase [Alcaligenes sp. SDU_A2]|uniref:SDR family oxidoreductase n=1 Tax=Alcaligenes sp. SDU_A2 TaxID=3136634 RepID=UPI00311E2814